MDVSWRVWVGILLAFFAGVPSVPLPPEPDAFSFRIETVTAADLGASYRDGCPVGPGDLRLLTVDHVGFDGLTHSGRLVVAADWAQPLAGVFETLYRERFPLRQVKPVTDFDADDDTSMAADNSSAFNCRAVTGGDRFSQHSHGTAIDLNPIENPYVSGDLVAPDAGRGYLDRSDRRPGMIVSGDVVTQAFAAIGWSWGGDWSRPVDHQHFSASGR